MEHLATPWDGQTQYIKALHRELTNVLQGEPFNLQDYGYAFIPAGITNPFNNEFLGCQIVNETIEGYLPGKLTIKLWYFVSAGLTAYELHTKQVIEKIIAKGPNSFYEDGVYNFDAKTTWQELYNYFNDVQNVLFSK
ncbi:hypothetical protein MA9V2_254 [Chryseobacterium phage MA9V-2]|nr:hypothetical protein MA9V2_254 [Chryseobacterium phage MA9V-2]